MNICRLFFVKFGSNDNQNESERGSWLLVKAPPLEKTRGAGQHFCETRRGLFTTCLVVSLSTQAGKKRFLPWGRKFQLFFLCLEWDFKGRLLFWLRRNGLPFLSCCKTGEDTLSVNDNRVDAREPFVYRHSMRWRFHAWIENSDCQHTAFFCDESPAVLDRRIGREGTRGERSSPLVPYTFEDDSPFVCDVAACPLFLCGSDTPSVCEVGYSYHTESFGE